MENKLVKVANPYNDNELEFNQTTGRYQLTLAGVKSLFDVCPIRSDAVVLRRASETSRLIYNYILGRCYSGNQEIVRYLLNYTENGRAFLKEVLAIQVEADFNTGLNSLGKLPAINVANGQTLDREQIRLNQVCVQAEDEIRLSQTFFAGINLLYQAPYNQAVYQLIGD